MSGNKSVGVTFQGSRKSGYSAVLTQTRKIRPAAGQQLMHIRLMTDIKNQAVFLRIKNGLNGDAQFHNAQIPSQMTAGLGYAGNQKLPDLLAQAGPFFIAERQQVLVTVDSF